MECWSTRVMQRACNEYFSDDNGEYFLNDVITDMSLEQLKHKYSKLPVEVIEDYRNIVLTTDTISYHYRVFNRHLGDRFRAIVSVVLKDDYLTKYKYDMSNGFTLLYSCNDELSPVEFNVSYVYHRNDLQMVLEGVFNGEEFTHVSSRDTSTVYSKKQGYSRPYPSHQKIPTYNITDEYQLRRNTVRASTNIPWVSCGLGRNSKISSVYWNDTAYNKEDNRVVYVCDDTEHCVTTNFYDETILKQVIVTEWFVFPIPTLHRSKNIDYWVTVKKAVEATMCRYAVISNDDEKVCACESIDHSLILSKLQTFIKKGNYKYRLTNENVHCIRLGDSTITAVDTRFHYNAIMVCLSTIVSGTTSKEAETRAKLVQAVQTGLLAHMDFFFHPTAVVSPLRTLLHQTNLIGSFSKREFKLITHALIYGMECTLSSVRKLKAIHVPHTTLECDMVFLRYVVLSKPNHQDMYRRRFQIIRHSNNQMVLVSTFSRRPRIRWIGCVATCSPIYEAIGGDYDQIAIIKKLKLRDKKYEENDELENIIANCDFYCFDETCGPAYFKTNKIEPFVCPYEFVNDMTIIPKAAQNTISDNSKAYYFYKNRCNSSDITIYNIPQDYRSLFDQGEYTCIDVGHTLLDVFVKLSIFRDLNPSENFPVAIYIWEDKQLLFSKLLTDNLNKYCSSKNYDRQDVIKIIVMRNAQCGRQVHKYSVRYVLQPPPFVEQTIALQAKRIKDYRENCERVEGTVTDIVSGGIRLDSIAYPIYYGMDNWSQEDGLRTISYVYAHNAHSDHTFISVTVTHKKPPDAPSDYASYEDMVKDCTPSNIHTCQIAPALQYTRNFLLNAVKYKDSVISLGMSTRRRPVVVCVVSFECIAYLISMCVIETSGDVLLDSCDCIPMRDAYFRLLKYQVVEDVDPRKVCVIKCLKNRLDRFGLYNTSFPLNKKRRYK